MYQSLHTTLMSSVGQPFEIQIRTEEMHKTAEYGIAAHWKYKETGGSNTKGLNTQEEKLNWLRQILEWQRDMSDNREFLSLLKGDLDLERLSGRSDQRCVQGLVHICLWHSNIIFKAPRNRRIHLMDHTECCVTVLH